LHAVKRNLLRANATLLDAVQRLADPVFVAACGAIAYRIYLGRWDLPPRYTVALLAAALLTLIVFPLLGLYQSQRGVSLFEELRKLATAWLLIAVIAGLSFFATKTGAEYSRGWAAIWFVCGLAAHLVERVLLRAGLRAMRRRGLNLRYVCIVGAGAHGRDVAARLRAASWMGIAVRGFYDDDPALQGASIDGLPVLGPVGHCTRDAAGQLDQVWIALPLQQQDRLQRLLDELRQTTVEVSFVPDMREFQLLRHGISEVAAMPVLNLTASPHSGAASTLKRVEDLLFCTLLLALTAPLWLAIAIGVKVSSPGPVLYRQERVTWNGRRFQMLKFRSMPVGAEDATGPVWAEHGEPRATRFGAFLRRSSLDELPQLVNVLRGEMSLVGPRPERPEFVSRFRGEVPGYMQKHLVKGGITGWAQVNDLRGASDLSKRIQYDLYYIDNWSLWFDLRILALTLRHILRSRNAQ
jgi:putative colanic acid biosysnthesis UDP-glucose lipid carrier transferase